jgi:mannose-1-phosphate guanylyltransferase
MRHENGWYFHEVDISHYFGRTRLWPVSRQELPKPFMRLGASTLLQQAVERSQAALVQSVVNKFQAWSGQHFTIGLKDEHQVTNTGKDELVLIEVHVLHLDLRPPLVCYI